MAQKKKRKTTKTTRKTGTAKKIRNSRMITVLLMGLFMVMALIAMFRLGVAGRWMDGLISLLVGSFSVPLILAALFAMIYWFWNGGRQKVSGRFWLGIVMLMNGWCLCAALPSIASNDPWNLMALLNQEAASILTGEAATTCGYLGAVLGALLTAAFSKTGAWLFTGAFIILAVIFIGWETLRMWLIQAKDTGVRKIKEARAASREKKEARLQEKALQAEEDQQAVPFNMDVMNTAKPEQEKKTRKLKPGTISILQSDSLMDELYGRQEQPEPVKTRKKKEKPKAQPFSGSKENVHQPTLGIEADPSVQTRKKPAGKKTDSKKEEA
ncbi:MAG: hypothetical protein HUJ54_07190, partial [Erysipelotrichaceae bacterium]|nr:hypothetical protein [Erysipelotrichaceae bacterium]